MRERINPSTRYGREEGKKESILNTVVGKEKEKTIKSMEKINGRRERD